MTVHDEIHAIADAAGVKVVVDPIDQREIAELLNLDYDYLRRKRSENPDWLPKPHHQAGHYGQWERQTILEWIAAQPDKG